MSSSKPSSKPSANSAPVVKQANNPLHGIKLADMLEQLVATLGWQEMAYRVNINCFKSEPSIKSSLKFLRRTPWARTKVEQMYLATCCGFSWSEFEDK